MAFSCFLRHSEGTFIVAVMAKLSSQTHSEGWSGKPSPVLGREDSACGNLGSRHGWKTSKCLLSQVCALRRVESSEMRAVFKEMKLFMTSVCFIETLRTFHRCRPWRLFCLPEFVGEKAEARKGQGERRRGCGRRDKFTLNRPDTGS